MFLFHGFSRNLYILRNPGWETDLECDTAAQALRRKQLTFIFIVYIYMGPTFVWYLFCFSSCVDYCLNKIPDFILGDSDCVVYISSVLLTYGFKLALQTKTTLRSFWLIICVSNQNTTFPQCPLSS
jgi:hypothetical protein